MAPKFKVGCLTITEAMRLPNLYIPTESALVIKARSTNAGNLYIANTVEHAVSHDFELVPGESVEIFTDNLDDVCIAAEFSGDVVEWLTEVGYDAINGDAI